MQHKGAAAAGLVGPLGAELPGVSGERSYAGKGTLHAQKSCNLKKSVNPDKIFLGGEVSKKKKKDWFEKKLKNPGLGLKTRLW